MQYNPKTSKDSNARKRFNEINEAYENLSNRNYRKYYDESMYGKYNLGKSHHTF